MSTTDPSTTTIRPPQAQTAPHTAPLRQSSARPGTLSQDMTSVLCRTGNARRTAEQGHEAWNSRPSPGSCTAVCRKKKLKAAEAGACARLAAGLEACLCQLRTDTSSAVPLTGMDAAPGVRHLMAEGDPCVHRDGYSKPGLSCKTACACVPEGHNSRRQQSWAAQAARHGQRKQCAGSPEGTAVSKHQKGARRRAGISLKHPHM